MAVRYWAEADIQRKRVFTANNANKRKKSKIIFVLVGWVSTSVTQHIAIVA